MTRVIGGAARGRAIKTPAGAGTRPTTDRVREALFSSLEASLGNLHGRAVLDLFAGSGAVGLEAASRGAESVVCVERDRATAALISTNARTLGLPQVRVLAVPVASLGPPPGDRPFDVVFLDPPYDLPGRDIADALVALAAKGWLASRAAVVVERSRRSGDLDWPDGFIALRDRRYGDTLLWYGRWGSAEEED